MTEPTELTPRERLAEDLARAISSAFAIDARDAKRFCTGYLRELESSGRIAIQEDADDHQRA